MASQPNLAANAANGTGSGGQPRPLARAVLAEALMELQDGLSLLQSHQAAVSSVLQTLQRIKQVVDKDSQEREQLKEEHKFICEYREYARAFRHILVEQLGLPHSGWLSCYLRCEMDAPAHQQPWTAALREALQRMGFTWEEWSTLCGIADGDITLLPPDADGPNPGGPDPHRREEPGSTYLAFPSAETLEAAAAAAAAPMQQALAALRQGRAPPRLKHTQGALIKALELIGRM